MSKRPETQFNSYTLFPEPPVRGESSSSFFSAGLHSLSGIELQSASVNELIQYIRDPVYRAEAISILSKRREYQELGLILWNSSQTAFILLQEVTDVYKKLIPGILSSRDSNRVCNALALLQSMASHPDVKMSFITARMPVYLYPLLHTTCREKPFEYLRLTGLGVIGSLVKVEDANAPQIVHFLLDSEVFPLCLRCMEVGEELSKTVATFIMSKMLMQEEGLSYCCATAERFYAVANVMSSMINGMGNVPVVRLLRHIIHCYLTLSEMPRACDALKSCFPPRLRDTVFLNYVAEDSLTMRMLEQLYYNVSLGHWSKPEHGRRP